MKRENKILNKIIELKLVYKILLIVLYLVLSIGIVFFISNKFNFKYRIFNEVSVFNNIKKTINDDTTTYEFNYSPLYSKRLFIKYESNDNYDMGVTYKYTNGVTDVYSLNDVQKCSKYINLNVINSKVLTNYISITVPNDVVIKDVIINNKLTFNYAYLFIFIIVLLVFIGILIVYHYGINKLHVLFAIFYVGFGSFMILFSNNTVSISWDDQIHFENTVKTIKFDDYMISEAEEIDMNLETEFYYYNSIEEQQLIISKLNDLDKNNKSVYNTNIVNQASIAYLPGSILYNMFKSIGINFTMRFMLVKFIGLFTYAFIIGYAIKKICKYKLLLFVLGLVPTGLFIATNYNYDSVIYSLMLLGFATFINMLYDKKVKNHDLIIYIVCVSIASIIKIVYSPFLLLLFLIPNEKFKSEKNAKYFKIFLVVIMLLVSFTFFINSIFANVKFDDVRGGNNVSVDGQIRFILSNPILFSKIFISNVVKNMTSMLMAEGGLLLFAYRGYCDNNNIMLMMYIMFGLVILSGSNEKNIITRKGKILIFVICLLIICMTWGVLYLTFNDVGSTVINGVQPRYFMSLLPFVILLFINNNMTFKISDFKLVSIISTMYLIIYLYCTTVAYLTYI